jgi:hypothetical protein
LKVRVVRAPALLQQAGAHSLSAGTSASLAVAAHLSFWLADRD